MFLADTLTALRLMGCLQGLICRVHCIPHLQASLCLQLQHGQLIRVWLTG